MLPLVVCYIMAQNFGQFNRNSIGSRRRHNIHFDGQIMIKKRKLEHVEKKQLPKKNVAKSDNN